MVTVYGRLYRSGLPVAGSQMNTTWLFKNARMTCGGTTNANGIASCKRSIGKITDNYRVNINVTIAGVIATTWFVP